MYIDQWIAAGIWRIIIDMIRGMEAGEECANSMGDGVFHRSNRQTGERIRQQLP
jgi:hypothetical protein